MRGVTLMQDGNAEWQRRFQLTRLMRGVTISARNCIFDCLFQLTRLMRGVTSTAAVSSYRQTISTHTPHARRDVRSQACKAHPRISTHTPHARRDNSPALRSQILGISTHTPHARRDLRHFGCSFFAKISTHTPHARRDLMLLLYLPLQAISTHTPHARRDLKQLSGLQSLFNFNSHASCEA